MIDFRFRSQPKKAFLVRRVLAFNDQTTKPPCSPVSQFSGALLLVTLQQPRSWPSMGTTNSRQLSKESRATVADSREIKCDRFSHRQVIRILHHCVHQEVHGFEKRASIDKPLKTAQPDLSQVSTARKTDPSITRSKTSQPSQGWRPTRPRGVQVLPRSPFNVRPPKRVVQY